MRLDGMSALVTGGASGLGEAVAAMLREGGARVAIFDLADEASAPPGELRCRVDVTDSAAIAAGLDRAVAAHGAPRIVVCCAGIGEFAPIASADGPMPLDHLARVIAVNLVGTLDVVRQAAHRMLSLPLVGEERGVIVQTGSIADRDGLAGEVAYAAAKAGLAGATLPLARDLAPHAIRVATVAPGVFATPLLADLPAPMAEALTRETPFPRRFGAPAEFAALVAHVITNPMLNGETIRLDAGLRMGFAHPR